MRRILFFVAALGIAVVLVASWAVYASCRVPSTSFCEGVGKYSLRASTQSEREEFFSRFGYKAQSLESFSVTVPSQGEVLQEYNEIQKSHGLNILPYSDKQAQMYVLALKKENDEGESLYGFITVYKGRVIAAHISDCTYPARVRSLSQ